MSRFKPTAKFKMYTLQHDYIIYLFFMSMQHISPRIQLIRMNFDFFKVTAVAAAAAATKSNGLSCLNDVHVKVHLLGNYNNSMRKLMYTFHPTSLYDFLNNFILCFIWFLS